MPFSHLLLRPRPIYNHSERLGILIARASWTRPLRPCRVLTTVARPSSRTCLASSNHLLALPMAGHHHRHHLLHGHSRGHSGHSHHHHHAHDNTYLTSTNTHDAGVRITRLGLFVNLGMALSKGVGGWLFHSQALMADAFHALTDLVSDMMTLATISVALKPPTSLYPNGFGKVESLGSLVVSGLLLSGGVFMCQHAAGALLQLAFPEGMQGLAGLFEGGHGHGHHHHHDAAHMIPNLNAAWLAGGSILIKEYLYRATMKIARERKSSILASNAVHHRVDSLTSIVALIAIGGSHILPQASWLDPVGGLIVSLMVIQAGFGNTRAALYELCDRAVDDEVCQAVSRAAAQGLPPAIIVARVQGVKAGQNYLMDIELSAPSSMNLEELRPVEQLVRARVGEAVRGTRRIRIRFISREHGADDEFVAINREKPEQTTPKLAHDDSSDATATDIAVAPEPKKDA